MSGKVLYSATHTHTGPYTCVCFSNAVDKEYINCLTEKTVLALRNAYDNLAAAELWVTETECCTLAFNRRYIMKNGKVLTNPGKLNPDIVRPEGVIDPAIPCLVIKQDGHYRLIIANISNHSDTTGGDLVSADWPGRMEAVLQHQLGEDIPVMTLIAPQGNINHFNVNTPAGQTSYDEARRIGKAYAETILSSLYQLKKIDVDTLHTASCDFPASYYTVTDEEYYQAKKVQEVNRDAVMLPGQDITSEDIAKGTPFALKFFAERVIECRDHAIQETRMIKLFAMQFGDAIGIVGIPAEPFAEIGIAIRRNSRFPHTLVAALSMGEIGYVGLPENYGVGGYETTPSREIAGRTVGTEMIQSASKLLNRS